MVRSSFSSAGVIAAGCSERCPGSRWRTIGVIALVGMHDDAGRHTLEQSFGRLAIHRLTAGQQKGQRPTAAVGQGVDLRRPPAARAADRLAPLHPLPPPAQRCALTAELSSRRLAGGPPDVASSSNKSSRRLSRPSGRSGCTNVLRGPYDDGASAHRPPEFSTWMIPLITRRSSTRGTPRGLLGNNGASGAHCPLLSQNSSVISALPQFGSVKSDPAPLGNPVYRSGA